MDAATQIAKVFDCLCRLDRQKISKCKTGEQIIYYVIMTRCEKDMGGFSSVFEQGLKPRELEILIDGLQRIDEPKLAAEFQKGLELLQKTDFYSHMDMENLDPTIQKKIEGIGKRVGDRLWDLDEKLFKLLNSDAT